MSCRISWIAALLCLTALNSAARAEPAGIDMTRWRYNAEDNVYYQLGIPYCERPVDLNYQTLALFVPGSYLKGSPNGDGTYRCVIDEKGSAGGYRAENAPIVVPVETPGYMAMPALTDYASVKAYADAGFVLVYAGCRGRAHGAPLGVVDLKAAVRFVRREAERSKDSAERLPGSVDRIFTFGMSGGGAQSALMGAAGDSPLYAPYLTAIGAVQGVSDAVAGAMCWCPITNLDWANEAYEWNLGVSRTGLSAEMRELSGKMAESYAAYVNAAGFKDSRGNVLTLEQSPDRRWQAGSYYDMIKAEVETSLNHFLADTPFPYDAGAAARQRGMSVIGRLDLPAAGGSRAEASGAIEERDHVVRRSAAGSVTLSGVYRTAQDYIDALNAAGTWVSYDAAANTATISGLDDFVKALKPAAKAVGAFDDLGASQGENMLFGVGDGQGAHFDAHMAELLDGTEYGPAFAADLAKTDALGVGVQQRLDMYTPLYYLLESSAGFRTSNVASCWRIRTGIEQGDTALNTEINLARALENCERGRSVDFAMVWGLKHVEAERRGSGTENFIQWVNACLAEGAAPPAR